jgi:ATP-binding protein involved in chromosome partitioning
MTPSSIKDHLLKVLDPSTGIPLLQEPMISSLSLEGGTLTLIMELMPSQTKRADSFKALIESELLKLPDIKKVQVLLTAHRPKQTPKHSIEPKLHLPHLKSIIAVASGKGGVGKSTVALNLALCLAQQQLRVGLLDLDIYGPSLPKMLGIFDQPKGQDGKIIPFEKYGIKAMSMGFLIDQEKAIIWRGPMVQMAVQQLLRDVDWGELDVLVVDMPPGTGDAHLTMVQTVPLAGAIIVSTPQDLALLDARRGIEMFRTVHVPILGLIENMSFFECPHCHHHTSIFHHGGAKEMAHSLDIPFLGNIPLNLSIRESCDQGTPFVLKTSVKGASLFKEMSRTIAAKLSLSKAD